MHHEPVSTRMSNILTFPATLRTATGGSATRLQRAAGLVPVTLSVPNKPSVHVTVDIKTAVQIRSQVVHLLHLTIGDKTVTALKGDIVVHVLKDNIEHIDLVQVDEKSEIKVDVNVAVDARNCPGVKVGGIVEQRLRKVKVKCPALAIPDSLLVNLDAVQLQETVYAKALILPKGVTLLTNPKFPVLSVVIPRGMKKTDDAAATTDAAPTAKAAAAPAAAAAAAPAKKDEKKK